MKEQPRRFKLPVQDGQKHPNGSESPFIYGCYFPMTNLVVYDMGQRGTGQPKDVEWIDEEVTLQ